jgi:hypothetical protein
MIRKRIAAFAAAILTTLGMVLATTGPAQAIVSGQPGYQYIANPSNSASGYIVRFGCGLNVGINPTWNAGEGQGIPACGADPDPGGQREPLWVWIGKGWCATRSIWYTDAQGHQYTPGYQNLAAGDGYWFLLQQTPESVSYHNLVKAWTGAGCPASGPAWVDNQPPGVPGWTYQW